MAGSCEYGDEPSGSGSTELVLIIVQDAMTGQIATNNYF
jgi:hypothetical protein